MSYDTIDYLFFVIGYGVGEARMTIRVVGVCNGIM